jgi:SAM-dependent methyltransferase
MSLDQVNLDFNDALQTYYPRMGPARGFLLRATGRLGSDFLRLRTRLFNGRLLINERIVEYAVVLRWMPASGRVLDVGCVSSRFPMHLASLGYEVCGIDVRPYSLTHRNFHFVKNDLFQWNTEERFDVITAISTIEHFGIGRWGDRQQSDGDRVLVERLARLARPGAVLLASVPFGRSGVTPLHRVYDAESLGRLFAGFPIRRQVFFRRVDQDWIPSSLEDAAEQPFDELPVRAVVVLEVGIG